MTEEITKTYLGTKSPSTSSSEEINDLRRQHDSEEDKMSSSDEQNPKLKENIECEEIIAPAQSSINDSNQNKDEVENASNEKEVHNEEECLNDVDKSSDTNNEDLESSYDNLSDDDQNEMESECLLSKNKETSVALENETRQTDPNSMHLYIPCDIGKGDIPMKTFKTTDPEIEIMLNTPTEEERSWVKVVTASKEKEARKKRILYFANKHRHLEQHQAIPYKTWILGLTQKHRFEIIIGLGLLMWIAFFICLAIVVNGSIGKDNSDTTSGSDASDNSGATSESINLGNVVINGTFPAQNSTGSYKEINNNVTRNTSINIKPTTMPSSIETTSIEVPPATRQHLTTIKTTLKTTESADTTPFVLTAQYTTKAQEIMTVKDTTAARAATTMKEATTNHPTIVATNENILTTTGTTTTHPPHDFEQFTDREITNAINYAVHANSTAQLLSGKTPNYEIGVGRSDITGPAADINMMGYANPSQTTGGIHMRQFSRAFIVVDPVTNDRTLFVNIDACMASTLLKLEVLKKLKEQHGTLYTAENVCISGTHTHSAPAGYLEDVLFQITSWGYVPETLTAMVNGIVKSINAAHENIQPGFILINKGILLDSNINRSPTAYLFNSAKERARYEHDVDKDMTLLKFLNKDGKGIGMINWFPVHCTSMNNTNTLISGDNKGYAELMFEQHMDPSSLPGESFFVAAFAQSNEGDVSPNTRGAYCVGTNMTCHNSKSTCNGKVQDCIASGPGKDMFESTKIIGTNQLNKALELYDSASILLEGPVQFVHKYVNMTKYEVIFNSTVKVKTCKPAMGFSFAAGTTDGPGAFDFSQGDTNGSAFWKIVRKFLHDPTEEQKACQAPKPILIDTGEMNSPYEWQPDIVETQILRFGQLFIVAVPGEFTTMSGRRLRETVLHTLEDHFPNEKYEAVVAGLSNTYSDYIATFEEYHAQRYEGASTIYGPFTLHAYLDNYKKLTNFMAKNVKPKQDCEPENLLPVLQSYATSVIYDTSPTGYTYGSTFDDVNNFYELGEEVVVKFVAGNPRNTLEVKPDTQFSLVEMEKADGSWEVVHNDASWDTKYIWERVVPSFWGQSNVIIKWKIDPLTTIPGKYRIVHNGHYKWVFNRGIYSYKGTSKIFYVVGKTD